MRHLLKQGKPVEAMVGKAVARYIRDNNIAQRVSGKHKWTVEVRIVPLCMEYWSVCHAHRRQYVRNVRSAARKRYSEICILVVNLLLILRRAPIEYVAAATIAIARYTRGTRNLGEFGISKL